MRVIGINDSHNASACLIEDGEIVFAIQEERLTGTKNWCGFPRESILSILKELNLTLDDIDFVAYAGESIPFGQDRDAHLRRIKEGETFTKTVKKYVKRTFIRSIYDGYRDKHERTRRVGKLEELGLLPGSVSFVNHHECHAAAAYYGWGIYDSPVLVLTNDGFGDELCATVSIGEGGRLRRIAEVPGTESIATIYAYITAFLGMLPMEHEYKIMGMAPYASKSASERVCRIFEDLMTFDASRPFVWKRRTHCPEMGHAASYLRELTQYIRFDHLCGGLQMFIENMLITWVGNCVRETGIHRVALGGGTFMNVKANKLISELPDIEDLFVFPSCGDESNAFGAAYYTYWHEAVARNGARAAAPFKNIYLGKEFTNEYIEGALSSSEYKGQVRWQRERDINQTIAKLLAKGEVVARFSGRDEFGARALGNRSILADPGNYEVVRRINEAIKCRDFWMPFAPAVRAENAWKYLRNGKCSISPYMMMTYDSNEKRKEFIAGIHPYDLTCRMQMVRKEDNEGLYDVLGKFEALTGRGVILNTSFNLHGYPIVHDPRDALNVLLKSGLRCLAMGDVLVTKG